MNRNLLFHFSAALHRDHKINEMKKISESFVAYQYRRDREQTASVYSRNARAFGVIDKAMELMEEFSEHPKAREAALVAVKRVSSEFPGLAFEAINWMATLYAGEKHRDAHKDIVQTLVDIAPPVIRAKGYPVVIEGILDTCRINDDSSKRAVECAVRLTNEYASELGIADAGELAFRYFGEDTLGLDPKIKLEIKELATLSHSRQLNECLKRRPRPSQP